MQVGIGQPTRPEFGGVDHQQRLVDGREVIVPDGRMPGSGRRERTADEVKRRSQLAFQDERYGDGFQRPGDKSSRTQRWNAFNGGSGSGHVITDFGSLNGSNEGANKTGGPPTPWALNAAQFVERMRGGDAHKVGIDASLNLPTTGRQATGYHEAVSEKSTTPSRNNRRNFVLV